MLGYYGSCLSAVEINASFYRLPERTTVSKWKEAVPKGFRFVLKLPRFVSPSAKGDLSEAIAKFEACVAVLQEQQGPSLLLIAPSIKYRDAAWLGAFLDLFSKKTRLAIDARHPSFHVTEVERVLERRGHTLVINDGEELSASLTKDAPFTYARLRRETYDMRALRQWYKNIQKTKSSEAYVFFKHDDIGHGGELALQLAKIVDSKKD